MAKFISIPTSAVGYSTATIPAGAPIQVPADLVFQVVQTSATVTVIHFDNRIGVGQKTLTLTHSTTAGAGTVPVVANAIYAALTVAPGGVFLPVSMPVVNNVPIVVASALYA